MTSSSSHWSKAGEAGTVLGMRILLFCFRYFGRNFFRVLLWPVILYFFLLRRQARLASLDFLRRVSLQAESAIGKDSIGWWQSFKHFLMFGELLLDKLAVWQGRLDASVVMHNRAALLEHIQQKNGAVLLASHLGNTEVCEELAEQLGYAKINVLVHTQHAVNFNRLMATKESAQRVNLIQISDITPATAIILEERLQRGELIAIAADRTPPLLGQSKPAQTITSDFLGAQAEFPLGPFILAALLRRPVFFLCGVKTDNHYDIYVEKLADRLTMKRSDRAASLAPTVQQYADRLAHYAQRFPLQWGNFYNFWKRSNSD